MDFNQNAGDRITRAAFDQLRDRYKKLIASKAPIPDTEAYYFGRGCYEQLLALPGCVGIRAYHGLNDANEVVHMLVPYDQNNEPLSHVDGSFMAFEFGQPCPPVCNRL